MQSHAPAVKAVSHPAGCGGAQVQRSLRAPGFSVGTVWCTACLGPDERFVAAGSSDGTVFIWEARPHLRPQAVKAVLCGFKHFFFAAAYLLVTHSGGVCARSEAQRLAGRHERHVRISL